MYLSSLTDSFYFIREHSNFAAIDRVFKFEFLTSYDVAAPLLCAGIAMYSPLRLRGASFGKKIAIIGLGGLGYMVVADEYEPSTSVRLWR